MLKWLPTRFTVKNWGAGRKSRWVAWAGLEMLPLILTGVLVSYYRLLHLEPIEVGGDALKVWEFARSLAFGESMPEELNHHTSRFGLVIPALLVQKVVGSHATSYFVAPLVSSVVLHLLVYLVGKRLSGPVAGAVGVLVLLLLDPMTRASSQILPEAFGPTYIMLATYCLLLSGDARSKFVRGLALAGACLAIFFAYGSKLVYLYYAPGLAALLWFGGSQVTEAATNQPTSEGRGALSRAYAWCSRKHLVLPAVLTAGVLLLLAAETLFLGATTGAANRFSVVTGSHHVQKDPALLKLGRDFFALYRLAPSVWDQALAAGVACTAGVAAFASQRRAKLFALMLFVYFLLQTFVVRSFDPLIPWLEPHPRYLLAMAAPLAVMIGVFSDEVLSKLISGVRRSSAPTNQANAWTRLVGVAIALVLLFLPIGELKEDWEKGWGRKDGWHRTEQMAMDLTEAFSAGLPIVAPNPGGKPAWAAAAVLIEPDLLMRDGHLLPWGKFSRRYERGRYVARATQASGISNKRLDRVVKDRVRKRSCHVLARQGGRFMTIQTRNKKDCESLEQTFKRDPKAGEKPPAKSKRKSKARPRRGSRR